jgi:Ca2+-binding EF-hand superfamily protein
MSAQTMSILAHIREEAEKQGDFNLKAAFAKYDTDNDGSITHAELTAVITALVADISYDQVLKVNIKQQNKAL